MAYGISKRSERTVRRVWRRFCAAAAAAGVISPERLGRPRGINGIRQFMARNLRRDALSGFRLSSEEAAEIGVEPTLIRDGKPSDARPGTPEKVRLLRRRYIASEPLWRDDDVHAWDESL